MESASCAVCVGTASDMWPCRSSAHNGDEAAVGSWVAAVKVVTEEVKRQLFSAGDNIEEEGGDGQDGEDGDKPGPIPVRLFPAACRLGAEEE